MGAKARALVAAAVTLCALAACAHQQRPIAATTWPPPCAGSRILEVNNPTSQTWEVIWGDETVGTAGPGLSRLPVSSVRILDARMVGAPVFRVQTTRYSMPGPTIDQVNYRLLCE
jgi:hypothetical protein